MSIPTITLNNGVQMPALGYGVFQTPPEETHPAVITINAIARARDRTPAQVMLRWHIREGRSAIPKSVTPARIAENFDVAGFELTDAELAAIDALDTGVRGGPEPEAVTREAFGRDIPEA